MSAKSLLGATSLCLLVSGCSQLLSVPQLSSTPAPGIPALLTLSSSVVKVESGSINGQVLGLDGKPAANVAVHGYLISNNSASLISNNSASLVSNHAASFRALSKHPYLIQADQLDTRTDGQGRFTLLNSSAEPLNIEAVLSADIKALQFNAGASSTLQLAYTGEIRGQISALNAPEVEDFTGVDVYIPGTSYVAKADRAGRFTLSNVPVGTFELFANKTGLGSANASGVQVSSKATTTAPALALSVHPPVLASLSPENGGPGSTLTIKGERFGATTGAAFQVSVGGAVASHPTRLDDQTLQLTVPSGATSEDVIVSIEGVPSNALKFKVLKTLRFLQGGWDLNVLRGATRSFTIAASSSTGADVGNPALSWSIEGTAASVDARGLVTGVSAGYAVLKASSGTLSTSLPLDVLARLPVVTTFAGTATASYVDDAGSAARFAYPSNIAIDASDKLYVSEFSLAYPTDAYDWSNHRIRAITSTGVVSTYAGTSLRGYLNTDSGPATSAKFYGVSGLCVDSDNTLYVADYGNFALRSVSPQGVVKIVSGGGQLGPSDFYSGIIAVALDLQKYLYVSDSNYPRIQKISPQGQVSTLAGNGIAGHKDDLRDAAQFNGPRGLVVDPQGNVFVADSGNHRIRKIKPDGAVTTWAGTGIPGHADGFGQEAQFQYPYGLTRDRKGNLYVADTGNYLIRKINPAGIVTTVVGTAGAAGYVEGSGSDARFSYPQDLTVDSSGNLFVTDCANHSIRKVTF